MKMVLALFLISASVFAVDVPRSGISLNIPEIDDVSGVPDIPGTDRFRFERKWVGSVGTVDRVTEFAASGASGTVVQFGTIPNQGYYEFFESMNASYAKPWILSPLNRSTSGSLHGSITLEDGVNPSLVYIPAPGYVGADSATVFFTSNGNAIFSSSFTFNVVNTAPTLSLSASPTLIFAGSTTLFAPTTSDADGHIVSVTYDYGDGSTGVDAIHAYASSGAYTVTATAFDGFDSVTAQTTVTVVGISNVPTARIHTSDIVAFVNVPFTVDGTTSTDQDNQPLAFAWNFGDGTPIGSGAILSHVFTTEGTRIILLTVTDSEGFTNTVALGIEVLAESAAATFDSEIRVTSTYFPQKQNRDILQVFARVNIGDTKLDAGTTLALEYAGKRYTATLNARKKAIGWTIKQGLRRQTPGAAEITFKVRNTAIASLLSGLGAENDAEIDVPFRLELGPKTIQINVPTLFELSPARGKGLGELD